jgi:transposase
MEARVAELERQLAAARKHSGNSSKPPSSDIAPRRSGDIVEPPPKRKRGRPKKRRIGGQPGHPRHERTPFPPDQVDRVREWREDACPDCSGPLIDADEPPRTLQQVELRRKPVLVTEHRCVPQCCRDCGRTVCATLPPRVRQAGLVGPRLTALTGFLKGACHVSLSSIRDFFRDVLGVPISRGMLAKVIGKVSGSLAAPYDELLTMLPAQKRQNVDETGHKENGRRLWTWCFRAALFTCYKISPSRGSDVLLEVLGREFDGVLGCDYFSAYRKYMRLNENVMLQFCLAHYIRDVKFLAEHPNARNRAHGTRLLHHLRRLFGVIHRRAEYVSDTIFRRELARVRNDLVYDATLAAPYTREAEVLAERFFLHIDSYFRFLTEPDVAPTNNLAEQALRFVAIHRRITQGTRGDAGQRWCERIWTAIGTCAQQGRSVFEFLCKAVTAHLNSTRAPSLAPDTS